MVASSLTSEQPQDASLFAHGQSGLPHEACRERLTAIGEMTAEFAHQVRIPLATAMLYVGQIDTSAPAQARVADKILTGLYDLQRMVNDLLAFAAGARRTRAQVNVQDLMSEVYLAIKGQLRESSTLSISVADPGLKVTANRDALKGALLNLVTNADQSGNERTRILLHGHGFGDTAHLCVSDNGPGIPDDVLPRLFEPFFTTRPQGTGLGLPVVQAVAAAHGGDVTVATSALGSSFSIRLPQTEVEGAGQ